VEQLKESELALEKERQQCYERVKKELQIKFDLNLSWEQKVKEIELVRVRLQQEKD
jgi:hypothetical protein